MQKPFPVNVCTLLRRYADCSAERRGAEAEGQVGPEGTTNTRLLLVARLGGRAGRPLIILTLESGVEAETDDVVEANVEVRRDTNAETAVSALNQSRSVLGVERVVPPDEPEVQLRTKRDHLAEREVKAGTSPTDPDATETARTPVADPTADEPQGRLSDGRVETGARLRTRDDRITSLTKDELTAQGRPDEHALTTLLEGIDAPIEFAEFCLGSVHSPFEARDSLIDPLLPRIKSSLENLPLTEELGVVRQHTVASLGTDDIKLREPFLVGLELSAFRRGELPLVEQAHFPLDLHDLCRQILGARAGHVSRLAPNADWKQVRGTLAAEALALLHRRSVTDERGHLLRGDHLLGILPTVVDGLLALGVGRHGRTEVCHARRRFRDACGHPIADVLAILARIGLTSIERNLQRITGIGVGRLRAAGEADESENERNDDDNELELGGLDHVNLTFFETLYCVGVTRDPLRRAATYSWARAPQSMKLWLETVIWSA